MSDRLLLLDKGGSTLFFGDLGPESSHLIQYFTKNGAPPCDPGDNPAEWILDVTGNRECDQTSLNQTCDKWPRTWQQSEEKQIVLQQLADIRRSFSQDESLINGINEASVYVSSYWKQFLVLSKRICQDQWRNPIYLTTKCSLCICLVSCSLVSFENDLTYEFQRDLAADKNYSRLFSMVSPFTTNRSISKASSVFFSLLICSLRSFRGWASKLQIVLPLAARSLSLASA